MDLNYQKMLQKKLGKISFKNLFYFMRLKEYYQKGVKIINMNVRYLNGMKHKEGKLKIINQKLVKKNNQLNLLKNLEQK